jgi:hypothetical protein
MKCLDCNLEMNLELKTIEYDKIGFPNVFMTDTEIYNCQCGYEETVIPSFGSVNKFLSSLKYDSNYPVYFSANCFREEFIK